MSLGVFHNPDIPGGETRCDIFVVELMRSNLLGGSKRVGCVAIISVFMFIPHVLAQTGWGIFPWNGPLAIPLLDPIKLPSYSLATPFKKQHILFPRSMNYFTHVDSIGNLVTVGLRLGESSVFNDQYYSLSDYLAQRSLLEENIQWRLFTYTHFNQTQKKTGGGGLTIETPKIRSKAFQRIFGGQNLSLNVKGNITLDGTLKHEKKSQVRTATDRAPTTNFQMKQTQNFVVTGKIGENVSVYVNQDSERPFEFENAIKLEYSSDEDGIIQKIEAGNVALSLPSTRFVTFSAQNSGLFGIKSQVKIGNLDMTAIASMEKGQKKKLSLSGGKEESTLTINDYDYKKGTYFFLDHGFRRRYPNIDDLGRHIIAPDSIVSEIEVYKSDSNYEIKPAAVRGWAVLDPSNPDTNFTSTENYRGYFLRLEPIKDYYFQPELGFIVMSSMLQESEILAVSYRDTTGRQIGTLLAGATDTSFTPIFKIIKPRTPRHTDNTWMLEWKNVYGLGSSDIDLEGFEVKMYYKTPSGDPQESIIVNGTARGFLNIFGLDNLDLTGAANPDNVIDDDPNTLSRSRGEIIFPNLRPFDPDPNAKFPFPAEMENVRTPAIYDTTNDNYIRQQSKFYLEVKSSRRSPNYDLGINVIEGTEEVRLNGTVLQKDKDYVIDYTFGTLTILNEEATNPNANIEITYESQQIMTIDKKSLMGARAEYTLWETGSNRSFLGATFLYLNQRTLDQRIRVGKDGPMQNVVWDVNTALNFEPNFITTALDWLPLLNVSGPSSISIEGEIAQVLPNPNTLNNEDTGDHDGVAYLDDFEGSKREISMGVYRNTWAPSSIPAITGLSLVNRGHLLWYNPYQQVAIQEIWPEREVTTNMGGTTRTHVLTLDFTPNSTAPNIRSSWGGIQKALSAGYADQTDSRFLEVWVRGDNGQLHVDLGQVSEDQIPNLRRDTEDKKPPNGIRNDLLDDDEDTGVDGVFGPDPPDYFHPHESATITAGTASPYDFWDLDGDGTKDLNEPWSYDDWSYESGGNDYSRINGTEGNRNDGTVIYPDTEDLNRNSDVDLNNDYFSYSFSLYKDHADTALIAGGEGNEYGWRMYRVPLAKPDTTVGTPDWSRIEFIRVWVDSADTEISLSIAEIYLAGNEWKLRGVMAAQDTTYNIANDSTMTIAVINTHDNPEYTSPPGVEGEIDPIQQIQRKEQSLVIQLNRLQPGETAIARKEFYQSENLINYHLLKMFVHGGGVYSTVPDSTVEFFLQWGSDTQNEHYYEVRLPVFDGWDERNNIEVDFETLSRLKLLMQNQGADSISELQENGHIISIFGNPSLTNIRYLTIGVKNKAGSAWSDQIWVDELRLSGVRKDKGLAMRVRADVKLADFITLNGEFNRKDADFHTVNERFGVGSNSIGGTVNAAVQLNKLLPSSWGFSIPVSANYVRSRETPKYLPGSDILVNNNTAPLDILQKIRTENEDKSLNVSFSKPLKSRNFFIRYLLDPIDTRFNYNKSNRSDSKTKYSDTETFKGSFAFKLSFGDQNYLKLFKWLGQAKWLKPISDSRFFYLPTNFNFSVNGSDSDKKSETSGGVKSDIYTANLSRNFSTTLKPFTIIQFEYGSSQTFDMHDTDWLSVFRDWNPGDALLRTQKFAGTFNPKVTPWLAPTFKYSSDYQWSDNPQQRNQGTSQSARVNSTMSISGTLDMKKLAGSFKKKTPSSGSGGVRRPVTRKQPAEAQGAAQKNEEKTKKPSFFSTVASVLGTVAGSIDPITFNANRSASSNDFAILGDPSFAYRIGISMDPEVPVSPNVTSDRSSSKLTSTYRIGSGFQITRNITAKLDYDYSSSDNFSTQSTGTVTYSALKLKNNDIPFPGWNVNIRGLEKLPFIKKIVKTWTINHQYSGKKNITWNDTPDNITQESISNDFRPLIGTSITFANSISANAQYATTETVQDQLRYTQGTTKRISSDITVTVKYTKQGGIVIPIFKKKLDNSFNISLSFTKKLSATMQSSVVGGEFTETARTENWSLKPVVTYTFTKTVSGGFNFEIGERKDLRAGTNRMTAFGINAVISLSDR